MLNELLLFRKFGGNLVTFSEAFEQNAEDFCSSFDYFYNDSSDLW